MRAVPLKERLLARISKDATGCWMWNGYVQQDGYGRIALGRTMIAVHRAAYTLFVGEIPDGMQVDHICWVRNCCNPDHLRLLTVSENTSRQQRALSPLCKHGHPFEGDNLYLCPRGDGTYRRRCRTCTNEAQRRYVARKAA